MDFKDLSYVIAIAKTQNITKAADMLYVTQPTLTKFLQNLERVRINMVAISFLAS